MSVLIFVKSSKRLPLPSICKSITGRRYHLLNEEKYDLAYQSSLWAVIIGNILIMINIVAVLVFNIADQHFLLFAIPVRIIVAIWAVITAEKQNRNQFGWIIFALILPAPVLILLGSFKKLRIRLKIDTRIKEDEQSKILREKAQKLAVKRKYRESVDVYNYILTRLPYEEKDTIMRAQLIAQLHDERNRR